MYVCRYPRVLSSDHQMLRLHRSRVVCLQVKQADREGLCLRLPLRGKLEELHVWPLNGVDGDWGGVRLG